MNTRLNEVFLITFFRCRILKIKKMEIKQLILSELWKFCEKEFDADFEEDYIKGHGRKMGMSNRTEKFAEMLEKKINNICKDKT